MKIITINLKSAMFLTIESNREVKKERQKCELSTKKCVLMLFVIV